MTAEIDVLDGTGLVAEPAAVKALVQAVLLEERVTGEVEVAFVDEAAITGLNEHYLEAEGPTDVLSFDYTEEMKAQLGAGGEAGAGAGWPGEAVDGGAKRWVSGEIVVCPQVVARYAAEEGRETAVQLGWTLIHGALHLAGYDHETDHGEMREREQVLLQRLSPLVSALSLSDGED